jgi:hypothetical protein
MENFVPFNERPLRPKQSTRVGWVVSENGCHIWCGYKDKKGYGRVQFKGRVQFAHRARYIREVGPIPEGMDLDHFACETPACCNPAHVRPVTRRENVLRGRGITAMQAARTHCPQGHPYSGDNLRVLPTQGNARYCRACARQHANNSYAKKRLSRILQENR